MSEPLIASSAPESTQAFGEALVTIDDIEQCVRKKLHEYPDVDWITSVLTESATSASVNDVTKWEIGQVWEFDDGTGERILVTGNSTNPISWKRGWHATDAYPHSANAILRKEPRFSRAEIQAAISGVVSGELWPHVYTIRRFLITPSTSTMWYAVPDDFGQPVAAFQKGTGSIADFSFFQPPVPAFVSTDISANGRAVAFRDSLNLTNQINYLYTARVTDSTIPESGADCICWGACARLMDAQTIPASMPDSDRATQEVPASDRARSAVYLRNRFEDERHKWRVAVLKQARPAKLWKS
jgi:hypothetical protein